MSFSDQVEKDTEKLDSSISINVTLAKILLEAGTIVDAVDKKGQTALNLYLKKRDPDVEFVEMLVNFGALPDSKDDKGNAPLHQICYSYSNQEDIVKLKRIAKLLIEKGKFLKGRFHVTFSLR